MVRSDIAIDSRCILLQYMQTMAPAFNVLCQSLPLLSELGGHQQVCCHYGRRWWERLKVEKQRATIIMASWERLGSLLPSPAVPLLPASPVIHWLLLGGHPLPHNFLPGLLLLLLLPVCLFSLPISLLGWLPIVVDVFVFWFFCFSGQDFNAGYTLSQKVKDFVYMETLNTGHHHGNGGYMSRQPMAALCLHTPCKDSTCILT